MPDTLTSLLDPRAVRLAEHAASRDDAIRLCGQALVDVGAAEAGYVESMLERERMISTYVGEGVAIPHGTGASKDLIRRDALAFLRFPDGVDWNGERVVVCVGIAATSGRQVEVLSQLAQVLLSPDRAQALREASGLDEVIRLLQPAGEDGEE